jgi:hypothetical protein
MPLATAEAVQRTLSGAIQAGIRKPPATNSGLPSSSTRNGGRDVRTESLRHAGGAIWSSIRPHRVENADDIVHLLGAEQCLGSASG